MSEKEKIKLEENKYYIEFKMILENNKTITQKDYELLKQIYGESRLEQLYERYIDDPEVPNDEKKYERTSYYLSITVDRKAPDTQKISVSLTEGKEDSNEFNQDESIPQEDIKTEDTIKRYLKQIGKYPLLTSEQEIKLGNQLSEYRTILEKLDKLAQTKVSLPNSQKEQEIPFPYLNKEIELTLQKYGYTPKIKSIKPYSTEGRKYQLKYLEQLPQHTKEIEKLKEQIYTLYNYQKTYDTFCNSNLRLVVSVAKHYGGQEGLQFLDLIAEGNIGLMKAVDRFDVSKGYKFSTYAIWWIRQSISRTIADKSRVIRLPVHLVEKINLMNRTKNLLTHELGREPTNSELSTSLGISIEKLEEYKTYDQQLISLETPVGEEEDSELGDFIPTPNDEHTPEEVAMNEELKNQIKECLATLTDKEAQVLILRFGLDGGSIRTLEEIGKKFNVTRERIRQIEGSALRKLKKPTSAKKLKLFLK